MKYTLLSCISAFTSLMMFATPAQSEDWKWQLPAHIPEPRVPADNPMSTAKVELGRHLFYDKRLSVNATLSCASCHQQERAFVDSGALSHGATGEPTHRNALSVANSAWNATYNWANPAIVTLEQQVLVPLFSQNPVEMSVTDANKQKILEQLNQDPVYQTLFPAAFPEAEEAMTMSDVIMALASFQRSIISVNSRFDRFVLGKEELDESAQRGFDLFFGEKAECHHCHGSFNFNDQVIRRNSRLISTVFHNNGLYNIDNEGKYPYPNRGLYEFTGKPEDMGAFRSPSLRNVEVTGPYMHDGSVGTLEEVVEQYARGGRLTIDGKYAGDGRLNPYRSSLIGRIDLSEQDRKDLVSFLKSLTDQTLIDDERFSDPWKQKPSGQ